MSDFSQLRDARVIEQNAILTQMRYELMDKVDECYLAWAHSGKPAETWDTLGILIHEVGKALNEGHYSFEEKRGAIKLISRCLDNFVVAMGKAKHHVANVS